MNKPNLFDELIKSRLEQSESIHLSENAWETFEQYRNSRLEHTKPSEISDSLHDSHLRQNLQGQTIPYNNKHWEILEQQIETVESRKNHVYLSKFIEIQAVFIIVLWLLHHTGSQNLQYKLFYPTNINTGYASMKGQTQSSTSIADYYSAADIAKDVKTPSTRTQIPESNPILPEYHTSETKGTTFSAQGIMNSDESELQEELVSDVLHSNNPETNIEFIPENDILLPTFAINELKIKQPNIYSEFSLITSLPEIQIRPKSSLSIGIYSAADVNLINTPFDKVYSIASYNKEAINNSFGIVLSRKLKALEAGIGLSYSKRKYNPQVIQEIYGVRENRYSQVTFNSISYDILSVPVHFNYRFIDKPSWGAYITTLVIANIVAQADYGITDIVVSGRPSSNNNRSNDEPRLEEKPFINGFLNGDNIRDDYFVSVGFGFGIEKDITNNISIILQPSYQRHILSADLGIGPNKDKIHTSSLLFGIKYKLK